MRINRPLIYNVLTAACLCDLARHFKTDSIILLRQKLSVLDMITIVYGSILAPTSLYQGKQSESYN
jgi:hypothetical protein